MINFIKDGRFSLFVDKLAAVSRNETDITYIDLSPNNIFDGDIGLVLVKNGSDILYRANTDSDFTNLSSLFPYIINPNKYLLESGINKKATWVKNSKSTEKTWKFLGYNSPYNTSCESCYTPPYIPPYFPNPDNPLSGSSGSRYTISPNSTSSRLQIRQYPVNPAGEPWTGSVSFEAFNVDSGSLLEVDYAFAGACFGSLRAENTSSQSVAVKLTIGSHFVLYSPTTSSYVELDASRFVTTSLTSWDGSTDFGGSSGVDVFFGLGASNNYTNSLSPASSSFSWYNGHGETITLPVTGEDTSEFSSSIQDVLVTSRTITSRTQFDVTYYYMPNSSISGLVWADDNNDSLITGGEVGIDGIQVDLKYQNGDPVPGFSAIYTSGGGVYSFSDVQPGNYLVEITPVGNYTCSYDAEGYYNNQVNVAVENGFNYSDVNFGLYTPPVPTASLGIGGKVWFDANSDQILDIGETGFSGITLQLETNGYFDYGPFPPVWVPGTTLATTQSNASGFYNFDNISPGDYAVEVLTPPDTGIYGNSYPNLAVPNVFPDITIIATPKTDAHFGYYPL